MSWITSKASKHKTKVIFTWKILKIIIKFLFLVIFFHIVILMTFFHHIFFLFFVFLSHHRDNSVMLHDLLVDHFVIEVIILIVNHIIFVLMLNIVIFNNMILVVLMNIFSIIVICNFVILSFNALILNYLFSLLQILIDVLLLRKGSFAMSIVVILFGFSIHLDILWRHGIVRFVACVVIRLRNVLRGGHWLILLSIYRCFILLWVCFFLVILFSLLLLFLLEKEISFLFVQSLKLFFTFLFSFNEKGNDVEDLQSSLD